MFQILTSHGQNRCSLKALTMAVVDREHSIYGWTQPKAGQPLSIIVDNLYLIQAQVSFPGAKFVFR